MKTWRRTFDMLLGRRPDPIQVGAVCRDPATGQVLLITSRGTGRWVIPKGWPMKGRTLSGAAAQEAWEEAGVRGRIRTGELGRFRYAKAQDEGFAVPIDMRVFLLDVDSMTEDFPERRQRKRRWFAPQDAARMVVEPGLQQILAGLPDLALPSKPGKIRKT